MAIILYISGLYAIGVHRVLCFGTAGYREKADIGVGRGAFM